MAAKIELTKAFNEGLSAPQPTMPEGASPAGQVLVWAAFQAGTRWKFDEHVTVDVFMGDPEKFYIFEAQSLSCLNVPQEPTTQNKRKSLLSSRIWET
ncbi:hypothetical protein BROUX41_001226 [Berkeleyomyces rouxiae]|uniref:uncharacterized protein n=1 Tax=Berkeleyomyces rouxiae TaxID=2035830 RepID=UPI003B8020DF